MRFLVCVCVCVSVCFTVRNVVTGKLGGALHQDWCCARVVVQRPSCWPVVNEIRFVTVTVLHLRKQTARPGGGSSFTFSVKYSKFVNLFVFFACHNMYKLYRHEISETSIKVFRKWRRADW
jgi:hypothetical protein